MPDEFASPVSQGGINLSGGQKQRLAIARAIVRRPDVYVFDDSFSALDFATDAQTARGAQERNRQRDGLRRRAAHQHSDRRRSHRRLDNGRVVGIGTHDELIKTSDIYREIVASQVSLEEVA